MYGNGLKRRTTPALELIGVAITTTVALTIQLLTTTSTIRPTATTATSGSRPTLIIK